MAENTGVQGEGSAVDATPQDIRENSAIEFSFFAVEVEKRFGILEQVDQEVVSGKIVRAPAPGRDWGWRPSKPRRRWCRRVKIAIQQPRPPATEVATVTELLKEKCYTILLCTMEYDLDRGWVEQPARDSLCLLWSCHFVNECMWS